MNKIDKILLIVLFLLIGFIVAMCVMYCCLGSIPESFAISVIGSFAGECGICGWIKSLKEKGTEPPQEMPCEGSPEETMEENIEENESEDML